MRTVFVLALLALVAVEAARQKPADWDDEVDGKWEPPTDDEPANNINIGSGVPADVPPPPPPPPVVIPPSETENTGPRLRVDVDVDVLRSRLPPACRSSTFPRNPRHGRTPSPP